MEQYIKKSALVAEIKRRIKINKECMLGLRNLDYYQGKVDALDDTVYSINTLEVKEVDLEKEVELWMQGKPSINFEWSNVADAMRDCAKHFYELGLSVNNPITAADRGIVEEIILSLYALGKEKMISYDKEIEWLRNKVKKGE